MMMLVFTIILAIFLIILGMRMMSHPEVILYFIATVVSIVALNVHIMGFSIYMSRIGLALIVTAIIVRGAIGVRGELNWRIDPKFLILFASSLSVQMVASFFAVSVVESFRQVFIYASMMLTFLAVLVLGTKSSIIIKAIKYYLAFAIVQGLVGIYQVIGAFRRWPMYNDLLVGIPVGNARNLEGTFWYPGETFMPRAFGFLSDTSHYAGYLVGVLLLALVVITWNRKLSLLVLFFSGIGLVLSLSRSGILTFVIFGLPVLIFLLRKFYFKISWLKSVVIVVGVIFMLWLGVGLIGDLRVVGTEFTQTNIKATLEGRASDLLVPGEAAEESFGTHIETRLLGFDAWLNHPLLGVGMGVNSDPWYSEKYNEIWRGAHSHHIDALGQTGLLGVTLEWIFMGLVGVSMCRGLKYTRRNSQERAVLIGLVAAFVSIILGNLLYHYYLNGFVWFVMGCGVALSRTVIQESGSIEFKTV